jgi:putative ABC transport system permease protein
METFWQDVRYGWRVLQRSPGFAAVAALTLAIGIGANAAIFSAVDAILLRPLPYSDPSRIVLVWNTDPNRNIVHGTVSPAEFLDWREMNHVFEEIAALRPSYVTVTGGGEPEQVWGIHVTGNFFRLFGIRPVLGRDFSPLEEQLGHERVAMISHGFWESRFGRDPAIVGKSVVIDYQPYQIVGVLPENFSLFGTSTALDIWVPYAFNRAQLDRSDFELLVFARLKRGEPIRQAQAEMETINAALKKKYPNSDQKKGVHVAGYQTELTSNVRPALLVFLAAVAFVLLIACANVANLMLARAASREREIALRSTLGAGRARILRQLLTESVLLAGIGGALGVIVAFGGIRFIHAALPGGIQEVPRSSGVQLNGAVLAFTVGLSLLTGIFFGLAPALQISRSDLSESLKEGSRGSTSGRRTHLLRSSLIVSEVALSLLLLVGAGLLTRSFVQLMSENLGFNPSNLLTMQVWLPENHYSAPAQVTGFFHQVLDRVDVVPGVKAASAVNFLMFTHWADFCDFDIAGRATPPKGDEFTSRYRVIDWQYLRTMGIRIESGRDLTAADGPDGPGVVLVNEALVRRYWPNENPVGKQIRIHLPAVKSPWQPQPRDSWLTIVGVVGDIREWDWGLDKLPGLYLPYEQNPSRLMSIVVRENGDPGEIVSAVRHIVASLDGNQPVTAVHMMDELLAQSLAQRRLSMVLLAVFATVAMLLAAVGIYGVMAYAVAQRRHEIGIRMALGAEPSDVLRMIVGHALCLAGIGVGIGLISSALLMRYLRSQLYGVHAVDPATFAGVSVVIVGVAMMSSYFPARRATRVDPLVALRYE